MADFPDSAPAPDSLNKIRRAAGLEIRDGYHVGRDPRQMTAEELDRLGHNAMSPLKALRLRCVDCCAGSANEVRLCVSVSCASWPFRMGQNPWRAPASEAQREAGRAMARRMAATQSNAGFFLGQNETDEGAATTLPPPPTS